MQVSSVEQLESVRNGRIGAIGKVQIYKTTDGVEDEGEPGFAIGIICQDGKKLILTLGERAYLLDPDAEDVVSAPAPEESN